MAFRSLQICKSISNYVRHGINHGINQNINYFNKPEPISIITRSATFFNRKTAAHLWKSCTSVSNAGRRRGRASASGRKMIKDLNKGQIIGVGRVNIQWPGLNSPIIRGQSLNRQIKLPDNPNFESDLIKVRETMKRSKRRKIHPLERGWSGAKLGGQRIGPPDPIGEEQFKDFNTWILVCKSVTVMTGNLGRKKQATALVVTGNGNGLAGFGSAKALDFRSALRKAKNKAIFRLIHAERYNNHTVLHDFHCRFGNTQIYVFKKHEGFGLVAHRVIKECCKAFGIKDLYAKVEGSTTNYLNLVIAFFIGLLQQKNYQQIADEKKLHLVEMRREHQNLPKVLASPSYVRKEHEISSQECLDFKQYIMGDRLVTQPRKSYPFYQHKYSFHMGLKRRNYLRNQEQVRIRLMAENNNQLQSFWVDKYPEARVAGYPKRKKNVEEE